MRRNLPVKEEWSLLGRKTSLCHGTKYPGVFKYYIWGCQERCCVESKGKEGKRWRAVYETVGKGTTLGRLRMTLMPAFFPCLSASPWKERLLVVLMAARPWWTPGHQISKAQEEWSITYTSSLVPHHGVPRWRVMPQGHSQSPHKTRISMANLSPSLSNSTTFHVLRSMLCPLLSSPSMASTTQCQLEPTSSRWGDDTKGWFSNWGLQEPLGCCWEEGALWRPCHTIADAPEPCGWASASHKSSHLRVKGCVGHWFSWNKCGDTTPYGMVGVRERGTLRSSVLKELQFIWTLRCMNMKFSSSSPWNRPCYKEFGRGQSQSEVPA